MIIIENNARYITKTTLEQCFVKGGLCHVNKVLCGNGFSTAFLRYKPDNGKVNIIIAPNKQVLISKKESLPTNLRVKFFYQESDDYNFEHADVLMFVTDSFLLYKNKLQFIAHKIQWVLIDEFHSVQIQSLFRPKLVEFVEKVSWLKEYSALTTVTATPNYNVPIDIEIKNNYRKNMLIHYTGNYDNSIARAKALLAKKKKVLVFTNDTVLASLFASENKVLNARLMVGEQFMKSLVARIKVTETNTTNLIIASSRAFEGVDIDWLHTNIFFYANRSQKHQVFYISNIYQAINRARAEPDYIEMCEYKDEEFNLAFVKNVGEVREFIKEPSISAERKMGKQYEKWHKYLIFETLPDGTLSIRPNIDSIRLDAETVKYNETYPKHYPKIFKNDIKIDMLPELQKRIKSSKIRLDSRVKMLKQNETLIAEMSLFGSSHLCRPPIKKNLASYKTYLETWLAEKNFDGNRPMSHREEAALGILSKYRPVIKEVMNMYNLRKNLTHEQAEEFRGNNLSFINNLETNIGILICGLVNETPYFPSNWVAHRNYNVLTQLAVEDIEYICRLMGISIIEVDIKACYPRFCYYENGMELPANFYGDSGAPSYRKNKVRINAALNSIGPEPNSTLPHEIQIRKQKSNLRKLGFDIKVANWVVNKFYAYKYKGDFFNFMAFREKQLISEVRKELLSTGGIDAVIRRHDSVILFNCRADIKWLNSYKYNGISGFFKV